MSKHLHNVETIFYMPLPRFKIILILNEHVEYPEYIHIESFIKILYNNVVILNDKSFI